MRDSEKQQHPTQEKENLKTNHNESWIRRITPAKATKEVAEVGFIDELGDGLGLGSLIADAFLPIAVALNAS